MLNRKIFQDILKDNPKFISKSGIASQILLSYEIIKAKQVPIIIVAQNSKMAEYSEFAELFYKQSGIEWISIVSSRPQNFSPIFWGKLWQNLAALGQVNPGKSGIILSLEILTMPCFSPIESLKMSRRLVVGQSLEIQSFAEMLLSFGYCRTKLVSNIGDFSWRGDILDIFTPMFENPIRIEFFGETIESIRQFQVSSQRSLQELVEFIFFPIIPNPQEDNFVECAHEKWNKMRALGEISIECRNWLNEQVELRKPIVPSIFHTNIKSIGDFLPKDRVFIFPNASEFSVVYQDCVSSWNKWLDNLPHKFPATMLTRPYSEVLTIWENYPAIYFENKQFENTSIELVEKSVPNFETLFWKPEERQRPWKSLMNSLNEWAKTYQQVILTFYTEQSRKRFLELSQEYGHNFQTEYQLETKGIFALISSVEKGSILVWKEIILLSEDVLQPVVEKNKARNLAKFSGVKRLDDIEPGSLLVHRDYGLCIFVGLKRLDINKIANDFIELRFANDDKVYLAVDKLRLVQRYKGPEGITPALDKLGGTAWKKVRSQAQKAIEKIAQDLVVMYASRQVVKKFAYAPMLDLYHDFEASFGFEETPDQLRCITDVLEDMKKPQPMDRLVCGDVGFGKTEIAMRAAFFAATSGKQVALLCPTTILAEQHFHNFKTRMSNFGLRVEMLSRFVPNSKQKKIIADLSTSKVDILIGTHRILSKDVVYPNIGLLILDEEQRFGVTHKEQIKKIKQNIDVLALSATPIPRTLQLSLSGIRSLSVIETPPVDRKPVDTFLIERSHEQLRMVVQRELDRKGQVFWVYNRVQDIFSVAEYVQSLVPHARVGVAHGQLSSNLLEDAIHKFWQGEIDVLVCTAIVESGIDFPKANTLIIDQAQYFGLGQLYQLRGRVGRSTIQAYAYFVVNDLNKISENVRQRMQVILDMDYLGAGLHVAMEDLRLRGAGNILGEAQSGCIGKVGLDLFLEMLEEEVQRVKNGEIQKKYDPELVLMISATIPKNYLVDDIERLMYYRALAESITILDIDSICSEMRDRFGRFPEDLENFINALKIKHLLKKLAIEKIQIFEDKVIISWDNSNYAGDPLQLFEWIQKNEKNVQLLSSTKIEFRSYVEKTKKLQDIREIIANMCEICS